MGRTALIFGAIAFVVAVLAGLFNSQLCVPCVALFLGLAAGYLAVQRAAPATADGATRTGAAAGAVSGVGALLGHLVGGIAGAARLGPENANDMMQEMLRGLGIGVPAAPVNAAQFYGTAVAVSFCFGAFEVVLMAGLGALGGILWHGMRSRGNRVTPPAAM